MMIRCQFWAQVIERFTSIKLGKTTLLYSEMTSSRGDFAVM
jgi:hypothetical protein